MREASHIFFNKNIGVFQIKTFKILTNHVISFEQSGPGQQSPSYKTPNERGGKYENGRVGSSENASIRVATGKNIWKMKFFPGQGKVRDFCGWPG